MALLASCHAAPDQTAPMATAGQAPAVFARNTGTVEPVVKQYFTGYRRFRGTIGGQPVTVELTIGPGGNSRDSAATCEGSYTYDRHPAGQLVLHGPQPFYPQRSLVLTEADTAHPGIPTGRWQANQPAGAVLMGTWTSPAGKQIPFNLHEDYTDGQGHLMAIRYEVVGEAAKVPCRPEREEGETKAEYRTRVAGYDHGYSQQFLHLLGPDTLRPSLQALQCLVPAARRQLVRAAAQEDDGCNLHKVFLNVDYNAYGLLALTESWEDDFITGARPQYGARATVCDLRTGQALTMENVFRPGIDTLLQRLITQHLLHDVNPDIEPEPGMAVPMHAADLAPLPSDFSIANGGVEFCYDMDEFQQHQEFLAGGANWFSVDVPYAELIPLLRPDSPVARMLRQRGLWPGVGPKRQ